MDYVIMSANMHCRITHFCVATLKTYSDHCPLEFTFTVTVANPSNEAQIVWTDSEDMNIMPSKVIMNISGPLKREKNNFINSLKDKNVVEKAIILQRSLTSEPPNIGAAKLTAFLIELVKDSNGVNGTEKFNKNHKRKKKMDFQITTGLMLSVRLKRKRSTMQKIISILSQGMKTNAKHTSVRRKSITE